MPFHRTKIQSLPQPAVWLLKRLLEPEKAAALGADFEQLLDIQKEQRKSKARWIFWREFLRSLFPLFYRRFRWRFAMYMNTLKVAFRNMKKQKADSLIHILGLGVGLACCILILLWVRDELSWDRFHKNKDRLFLVVERIESQDRSIVRTRTPLALGPALKAEVPEIAASSRSVLVSFVLEYGEKKFSNDAIDFADPDFFDMVDFPFLSGDPRSALADKYSIVLTETTARKYFGDENPMGKTMRLLDEYDLIVTGVLKDLPHNTFWQFDCLMPSVFWGELDYDVNGWEDFYTFTHVMLSEKASVEEVDRKIADMILKHRPESRIRLFLQPLTSLHLHRPEGGGNIRYVYIFSVIAAAILIIACINFANCSTARSTIRAREIGLRKVLGASRIELIRQFYGETLLTTLISLMVGLILVALLIPLFNQITGKSLGPSQGIRDLLIWIPAIILLTGLLAGSYPALFLSALKPQQAVKFPTFQRGLFRKALVVVQFSLSIFAIICALTISRQLHFMMKKDLGFVPNGLAYDILAPSMRPQYEKLREELLLHPDIRGVARSSSLPGYIDPGSTEIEWEGKDPEQKVTMHEFPVDFGTIEVMGMTLVDGRSFSRAFPTDTSNFILNEKAVSLMNLREQSPVGRRFSFDGKDGVIIGVVKNFHHGSLRDPIEPLVLSYDEGFILCMRVDPANWAGLASFMKKKWQEYESGIPNEFSHLNDRFDGMYAEEKRLSKLMYLSLILTLILSCLGLFGLSAFASQQRTKEVAVRKVLGATTPGLLKLLSWDFLRLILVSNIVSWPLAWWVMSRWLEGFAFRTSIPSIYFLISGAIGLQAGLLTVIFQTCKTVNVNPADSLKYE